MHKSKTIKSAVISKQDISDSDLALINLQSLKTLSADDVYTFKLAACNNVIDRDIERFTDAALEKLAKLFVGKPIISDHAWKAALQSARIYAGAVEPMPDGTGKQLVLRAYMLNNEATQSMIEAIEGGILREVSVGCDTAKAICSVCGINKRVAFCQHRPGMTYDGKACHVDLDEATDAYEVSFVAVPSQPAAGVTKAYGGEENPMGGEPDEHKKAALDFKVRLCKARLKVKNIETED